MRVGLGRPAQQSTEAAVGRRRVLGMGANLRETGVRSGMLQPNIVLPSQYFGSRRRLTPEHGLMIAVLQDAIDCVAKHRYAKDHQGRRLFDEATQWLLAEDADWPCSFECICAVLELDANAVRRALRLPERPSARVSREVKKALRGGGRLSHRWSGVGGAEAGGRRAAQAGQHH